MRRRGVLLRFRAVTAASLALALGATLLAARPVEAATGDQMLPNLKATPATNIAFGSGTDLRFSTLSWNAGTGPLELRAGAIDTGTGKQDVWQRIYLEGGGSTDRLAGTFVWHVAHNHFHFEDYARYTLQPVNAPGASSLYGQKTTFCVMDTTAKNLSLPGAPNASTYSSCGNTYQGMSVGWGDMYGSSLTGQSIDMAGMPNGDYRLSIEVDPLNHLSEATRTDNSSCVLLRISVTARTVTVLNPNSCDPPASVTSMTPSSVAVNGSINVTITGTSLTSGLAVSFANGNGPAPTVSNVVYVDATTITATVTVAPSRKKTRVTDPVWDLRVGTATLLNALTVTP
ncbi:MAG: lysyl oxidase family protein [Actinomycetota bacterium]